MSIMHLLIMGCNSQDWVPTELEEQLVTFEATTFDMGFPDVEVGPYGNHWKETAQPIHEVQLSKFSMDVYEVRVQEYTLFLNDLAQNSLYSAAVHHHALQPIAMENDEFISWEGYENRPMNYVSYYDALSFCAWRGATLPSEAEWERAAKGDDRASPRSFPWVDGGANCQKAAYYTHRTLCHRRPEEVGSHPLGATPEGIHDMGGNVSEWVWDWFERYSEEPQINPLGPDEGRYKIVRGGGFRETADAMRTTDRVIANPLSRSEGIGFRCVRREE